MKPADLSTVLIRPQTLYDASRMVERSRKGRPTPLGQALNWLRVSRKLTQKELADATRVAPGSIGSVETGVSQNPEEETLRPLLAYFGFDSASAAVGTYLAALARQAGIDSVFTRSDVEAITQAKVEEMLASARLVPDADTIRQAFVPRPSHDELARLPVYDYAGAAQRLMDLEMFPEPVGYADPPEGFGDDLSPDAFAVRVRGNSMAGWDKPIPDGYLVWLDPNRTERREGKPHVAVVRAKAGEQPVAVVKLYRNGALYSVPADGQPTRLAVHEIIVLLPVIAIVPPAVRP